MKHTHTRTVRRMMKANEKSVHIVKPKKMRKRKTRRQSAGEKKIWFFNSFCFLIISTNAMSPGLFVYKESRHGQKKKKTKTELDHLYT